MFSTSLSSIKAARKWPAVIALFIGCLIAVNFATASTAEHAARRPGHVYLLRGLLNVFSLGMDELAARINNAGVAATVDGYTGWPYLADSIVQRYRAGNREPIILMGHSNGADTTILVARRLNESNVPVALIVNFDPISPAAVPPNVRKSSTTILPLDGVRPLRGIRASGVIWRTST
jgi:hypothetical protein